MNTKAAHQALLQAARDQTTITYGETVGLAGLTLTGDALSDISGAGCQSAGKPVESAADPRVAHEDKQ